VSKATIVRNSPPAASTHLVRGRRGAGASWPRRIRSALSAGWRKPRSPRRSRRCAANRAERAAKMAAQPGNAPDGARRLAPLASVLRGSSPGRRAGGPCYQGGPSGDEPVRMAARMRAQVATKESGDRDVDGGPPRRAQRVRITPLAPCGTLAARASSHHLARSVPVDQVRAASLFHEACNAGDAMGCAPLADCYESGRGATRELVRPESSTRAPARVVSGRHASGLGAP